MNKPLISVVMAVRNGADFLSQAIDSVLVQTYQNFEIIIIDGHSTDTTAEIAKPVKKSRYFLQDGVGIADAYNQGIQVSQGDYVCFLSHDDFWRPNKLQVQLEYMLSHPKLLYTIGKVKFFLEKHNACPPGFRSELLVGDHVGRIMETLMAKKTLFDQIGVFDSKYNVAEDVDFYARCHDAGIENAVVDYVVLHKRVHDKNLSLTATENNQNILQILKQSIERKRINDNKH